MWVFRFIILLFFFFTASEVAAETAQERRMVDRFNNVDRPLLALEKGFYADDPTIENKATRNAANSTMETRISQLEEQIRQLTGKLEEVEFRNSVSYKILLKSLEQINLRFENIANPEVEIVKSFVTEKQAVKKIEPKSNIPASMRGDRSHILGSKGKPVREKTKLIKRQPRPLAKKLPSKKTPAKKKLAKKLSDVTEYQNAFSLLEQGKYKKSSAAFLRLIKNYPKSSLISDAYYWLGESQYAQEYFKQASVYFLKGYKTFPNGRKAPESLLKLAMSLGQVKQLKNACATLRNLHARFPKLPSAIRQQMQREIRRFNCHQNP